MTAKAAYFREVLELGQSILVRSRFDDHWLSFQGIPASEEISDSTEVFVLKGDGRVGNDRDFVTLERASQNLEMYAANAKGWHVTPF